MGPRSEREQRREKERESERERRKENAGKRGENRKEQEREQENEYRKERAGRESNKQTAVYPVAWEAPPFQYRFSPSAVCKADQLLRDRWP